jgi:hypothetical protein
VDSTTTVIVVGAVLAALVLAVAVLLVGPSTPYLAAISFDTSLRIG